MILALALQAIVVSPAATAANIGEPGISNFTPNRPSVTFTDGTEGFPYPSFNNFFFPANYRDSFGEAVLQEQRGGDERKFALARLCPEGDCNTPEPYYFNTVSEPLEAGDTVRFELYFHNNGEDPHDGDNLTSPNAENVRVGIDLSNLTPNANGVVRPQGFISADNNEYRDENGELIRYANGQPVNKATDDVSLTLSNNNLTLRPLATSANVFMNTGANGASEVTNIRNNTNLTLTGGDGTRIPVEADAVISGDQLYINFDQLPGCFRYSGYVYIDVVVEQPDANICTEVDLTQNHPIYGSEPETMPNGKTAYPVYINRASFSEEVPDGARILWTSDDPNGEFWLPEFTNGEISDYSLISNSNADGTRTITDFRPGHLLYYSGNGPVNVRGANFPDEQFTNACQDSVEIEQVAPPICVGLDIVNRSYTMATEANGQTSHVFNIATEFAPNRPDNAVIEIRTGNPDSQLFVLTSLFPIRYQEIAQTTPGTYLVDADATLKNFVYKNQGTADTITAKIQPSTLTPTAESKLACQDTLLTEEPQETVCREIVVTYQEPIYEGTTSSFSAQSFDEDGNPYEGGGIRYSVDEGHGTFSNQASPTSTPNPSPQATRSSLSEEDNTAAADAGDRSDRSINQTRTNFADIFGEVNIEKPTFNIDNARNTGEIQLQDDRYETIPFDEGNFAQPGVNIEPVDIGDPQPDEQTLDLPNFGEPNIQTPEFNLNNDPQVPDYTPEVTDPVVDRVPFDPDRFINTDNLFNSALNINFSNDFNARENIELIRNAQPRVEQINANDVDIIQALENLRTLNAEANEEVYLNATREGQNVVHVEQLDEDGNPIPECSQDFSIIKAPCRILNYEIAGVQNPRLLERNTVNNIRAEARFENIVDPTINTITYTIDEQYGAFTENEQAITALREEVNNGDILTRERVRQIVSGQGLNPDDVLQTNLLRNSGPEDFAVIIYADAPEIGGTFMTIESSQDDQNCNAAIQMLPETEDAICVETTLKAKRLSMGNVVTPIQETDANQLYRNSAFLISASSQFQNADPETNELEINLDEAYGTLIDPAAFDALPQDVQEALIRKVLILQDTPEFGLRQLTELLASVGEPADFLRSNLTVSPEQEVLVITYSDGPNGASALTITQVGYAELCNASLPIPANEDEVCTELTYTGGLDPEAEVSKIVLNPDVFPEEEITVTSNATCTLSKTEDGEQSNQITFAEGEDLTVFIRCPDYDRENDTIEIVFDGGANCRQGIRILPDNEPPVEEQLECIDLDITTPSSPWEIDANDSRQNFRINVDTNPNNREDELYYTWEVTRGEGQWAQNDERTLTQQGDLTQTLEDFDDRTRVEVSASYTRNGAAIPACTDQITANQEDEPTKPRIEKVVYPENDIDRADDIINVGNGDKLPYLTYMVVFKPGSDTKSVEIEDTSLRSGAIRGSQGGELTLEAMEIIFVEDYNDKDGEIIYQSSDYREDDSRDRAGDRSYRDNSNDDFDCEDTNGPCVVDYNSLESDFRNGRPLQFDNIDELGEDGRIIIKYQMDNRSVIDESSCQRLTPADGCGEHFENRVEYTSYEKTDFNDREDSGRDEADVYVICPYILTRQGGDVFFNSNNLNLGIDVATCSPVKGGDGIITVIVPDETPRIPSTGTDADGNPIELLDLPTHDICRYSNTDDNIANYKNALENFSSTVCELEAKVAEELQEENINQAIKNNINRIARFGQNLALNSLSSMNDLQNLENASSGVFYKVNGDLTISNPLTIESNGTIPGAQTYIIQNGDLIIKNNITYGATDFRDPRNIPSVAFIVLDGDIQIAPEVTELSGVYMAIDLDENNNDGKITQIGTSDERLTISGSLIGNVYELFSRRTAVGDPTRNEGSVTIKYDQRILLNTPPALGDLVDISQAITP